MAASRFSLEAILSLVDNLTNPYRQTTNKVNALSQKMKNGFKAVAKAAGRVAKALAVGIVTAATAVGFATVRMVNKMAEAGDEIGKTARQIDMGVEALQELRFAADRQGVSTDDLTNSLLKLNKNVGDLRAGTGALQTILNNTNPVLAEQLKNVTSNEEAFNLLVNEIGSLPNQMDKAALAQAAFGRSGQEMLKLIESGPEGLAALREEARSYGLMTEETTANSEAYIDALTNLKAVAKGLGFAIGADLIPEFTEIINAVKDFAMANKDLVSTKVKEFISAFKNVVATLKEPMMGLLSIISDLGKYAMPLLLGLLKATGDTIMFFMPLVNAIINAFKGLFDTLKNSGQLDRLKQTFATMMERLKPLRDTLIDIIATVRQWLEESGALEMIVSLFRGLGVVVGGIAVAFRLMWRIAKPILTALFNLLKPIFETITKITDATSFISEGISGLIGGAMDRADERGPRPEMDFWGRPRSPIEQQQAVVNQERAQEANQQRNSYDIYLHSAIAGTGISQAGSAPSTAVSLGAQ